MAGHVLMTCEQRLSTPSSNLADEPLRSRNLASLRSLIVAPCTPESTISLILETLTRSLRLSRDPVVLHQTLKLLSDLASHHPTLSRLVSDSVRSHSFLSPESTRLAAESLDVLALIAGHDGTQVELDDQWFVSLCFSPSVSVRSWLLRNAERFRIGPYVLLTLFLGFSKDPYPQLRKIALDGVVGLSKPGVIEETDMIQGCYCRAVELLRDMEDYVRSSAVRAVSAWGPMLAASNPEAKLYWSDDLFVKLCSMGRDMSMEVRVEAFDALGKIEMVSEDVLLQTLSKRVLGIIKEKRSLGQCPAEQFEILASSMAGVLVHGLEDEFSEVRKSACHSFRTLSIISAEFAGKALDLLMDVLNDDSTSVRLQALETMLHMATCGHLKVQETHMHMFLGTLMDSNTLVRSTTQNILKLVKLPNKELFRLSVDGLIESLEKHPQDEADIFSALFHIGRNHRKLLVSFINEVSGEVEPASDGKLGFDSVRVAALLVLAISAQPSHHACSIPPRIFSYAVTLLGRISAALTDVMSQDALFAYLSQCSQSTRFSASELNFREVEPSLTITDIPNNSSNEICETVRMRLNQEKEGTFELMSWTTMEPMDKAAQIVAYELKSHHEVMEAVNLILAKVKDILPLIQSGFTNEVLKNLRSFKEELVVLTPESAVGSVGAVAFTVQYLRVMKRLAKVWERFLPTKKLRSSGMGEVDLVLEKLEIGLRELRSRFTGLSLEQELQILELTLLACTLRLCKIEICCHFANLKKLSATLSYADSILKSGSIEPSNFVRETGKLCVIGTSSSGNSCSPFLFKELLKHFSLEQVVLCGRLNHIRAELVVPGNDSENPLPFVSRLPVGIPCEITLHNIPSDNKLWLRMTVGDESTQFVFLDVNLLGSTAEVQKFTYVAPFYRTPKAISFTLRICLGMECLFEDISSVQRYGGPERELIYICQEKEVYLSIVS